MADKQEDIIVEWTNKYGLTTKVKHFGAVGDYRVLIGQTIFTKEDLIQLGKNIDVIIEECKTNEDHN